MHQHRFFAENPLRTGDALTLSPDESRHITKALRLGPGAAVTLFDGRGREATGVITEASPRAVQVAVRETKIVERGPRPALHLLVPWLNQPQRLDWLIEKITELGVQRVTAFRVEERTTLARVERWRRLAIAAAKQSGQAWLPTIDVTPDATPFQVTGVQTRILFSERAGVARLRAVLDNLSPVGSPLETLALALGPEEGFEASEEREAADGGWRLASLGPTRLRSETAALAAVIGVRVSLG
jgi:16S rRNA (uracil1498-N3)-methyltransferase